MKSLASYAMRKERDVLARVQALHANPPLVLRERADLRFVSLRYHAGMVTYPALGFYAVSARVGSAALIREEGWARGLVRAEAGATFVQSPNGIVEYGCHVQHVACAMCIDPAEVERAAREVELVNPDHVEILTQVKTDVVCERLVNALAAQAELVSHPASELACTALRRAMATHLVAHFSVHTPRARARRSKHGLSSRGLKRALDYLQDNLQPCSLDDLAAHAGVSSYVVERQFRRAVGQSPARYLLQARVERAKRLLVDRGDLSEVAHVLGFEDVGAFRRVFRQFTGVSPESFAMLHGNSRGLHRSPGETLS